MRNDNWLVAIFSALSTAPFTAIWIAFALANCDQATGLTSPPFLGKWVDDSRAGLTVTLEFQADQSGTLSAYGTDGLISRARIAWDWQDPYLISRDMECSAGEPPVLIPCSPTPDTIRVSIADDEWPITLERDGEITSFHFRRSN